MKLTVANFFAWMNHGYSIHAGIRGILSQTAEAELSTDDYNRQLMIVTRLRKAISPKNKKV